MICSLCRKPVTATDLEFEFGGPITLTGGGYSKYTMDGVLTKCCRAEVVNVQVEECPRCHGTGGRYTRILTDCWCPCTSCPNCDGRGVIELEAPLSDDQVEALFAEAWEREGERLAP